MPNPTQPRAKLERLESLLTRVQTRRRGKALYPSLWNTRPALKDSDIEADQSFGSRLSEHRQVDHHQLEQQTFEAQIEPTVITAKAPPIPMEALEVVGEREPVQPQTFAHLLQRALRLRPRSME